MIIKQEPEHFFVKEVSSPAISDSGEYAYAILKKRNYTTDRAISAVSRALRVSRTRIGYAGNKDKFALTEQLISVWKKTKEDIEKVSLKDISLEFIGYSDKRICLGDLTGNCFEISVFPEKSDLSSEKEIKERAKLLSKIGVPNYFGSQRFGSASNNAEVAVHFLKGDFESAVKEILVKETRNEESNSASKFIEANWKDWKACINVMPKHLSMEKSILNHLIRVPTDFAGAFRVLPKNLRRIFIHSYQSNIWNKTLSSLLEKKKHVKIEVAGSKLAIPLEDFKEEQLEIIGFSTPESKSAFYKKSISLIEKDSLSKDAFKLPRMPELVVEGDSRNSKIFPENLSIEKQEDHFRVKFSLDKGAYATIILEALFSKK